MTDFSTLFKALADPTRRRILQLLKTRDLTPSQILEKIEVSQPTLSHHLDSLRRAQLIEGERDGQFIRYSLNMSVFDQAVEYMMELKHKR
jgi:DNA-binding transcriptional ArsR family regulator